jgi:hypothetical protein
MNLICALVLNFGRLIKNESWVTDMNPLNIDGDRDVDEAHII